jgi:hypothetical protein
MAKIYPFVGGNQSFGLWWIDCFFLHTKTSLFITFFLEQSTKIQMSNRLSLEQVKRTL